jgi:glucosamine--fructose-6-phosphate aminotransferase (isomerizing)
MSKNLSALRTNPYVLDILSQPEALRNALHRTDLNVLEALAERLRTGDIQRVVLTGMGASYWAAYPAWLALVTAGLPAVWVDTAELLHYARGSLGERTLLFAFSQSGQSVEIVSLLDTNTGPVLAVTNDLQSPLVAVAEIALPIHAEPEQTVSTRTYLNSLAVGQLAACALSGNDPQVLRNELHQTADSLEIYLKDWEKHLEQIQTRLGLPETLAILGRGPSLASAMAGALIQMEAAKFPALGLQTGEFRHGPIEIARPGVHVIVLAGPPETVSANRKIYQDLKAYQAQPHWVDCSLPAKPEKNDLPAPVVGGLAGLPLAEIVPLQLLSVHLAQARGIQPGKFNFIGKVTLKE